MEIMERGSFEDWQRFRNAIITARAGFAIYPKAPSSPQLTEEQKAAWRAQIAKRRGITLEQYEEYLRRKFAS